MIPRMAWPCAHHRSSFISRRTGEKISPSKPRQTSSCRVETSAGIIPCCHLCPRHHFRRQKGRNKGTYLLAKKLIRGAISTRRKATYANHLVSVSWRSVMGPAHHQRTHERFQTSTAVGTRRVALENCRKQLFRVRLDLAELKRTGSRHGLAGLTSDAVMLSMRMKRFETLLTQARRRTDRTAGARLLVFSR